MICSVFLIEPAVLYTILPLDRITYVDLSWTVSMSNLTSIYFDVLQLFKKNEQICTDFVLSIPDSVSEFQS